MHKEEYDKESLDTIMGANVNTELNENPDTLYKEESTEEIQNLLNKKLMTKK